MVVPKEREELKNFEGMAYGYYASNKLTHPRMLKIGEKKEKGNTLLSILVRSKLPNFFLVDVSRKTDCHFPSLR